MGGDPGRDVFTSPGDPAFYLHHAMVDRVWWIWQSLDRKNRLNQVSGTRTTFNQPPSGNVTLDDVIDLGFAGPFPPDKIRNLVDTTNGPFCYTYA